MLSKLPDDVDSDMESTVKVDCLIVGAGPAGASLACFLGHHGKSECESDRGKILAADPRVGLTGLVVAAAPSTADTPRAHLTNMAALGPF